MAMIFQFLSSSQRPRFQARSCRGINCIGGRIARSNLRFMYQYKTIDFLLPAMEVMEQLFNVILLIKASAFLTNNTTDSNSKLGVVAMLQLLLLL